MRNVFLSVILFTTLIFAEITAKPSRPSLPSKPITKPIVKPVYDRLNRDNYVYDPYYNDEAIAQEKRLAEKKEKIEALEKELNATRKVEQQALQKKNKTQYNKAMKEFDNRQSTVETKSSIIISDDPIK